MGSSCISISTPSSSDHGQQPDLLVSLNLTRSTAHGIEAILRHLTPSHASHKTAKSICKSAMFIFHHPNCLSTSSPSGSDQGQQPDFVFIESYKMNSSWP